MIDTLPERSVFVDQTKKYVEQPSPREYITTSREGDRPAFLRFVGDEAYAEALSGKVIQCIDIAVVDLETERILLGSRDQEPHSGDWVIGGAMRAGESAAEAAQRHMGRELKMQTDSSDFKEVGNYKFVWDSRAQEPIANEKGEPVTSCHTSSTLELYPVSEQEVDLTTFNDEYTELGWVPLIDILNAPEGTYHPCLVDMVQDTVENMSTPEDPKTMEEALLRNRLAGVAIKTHWPKK